MSSANLDKFKKDFDALAKSLPKPSTDPEKSEETKEVEKKAEGIFKANLSAFRSEYGGKGHIGELKRELKAKKLSLTDPLNPPTTTSTDLAITATKIKSLEEIDHLKTDKISDLRTVLSSPYQERIDSRLEAVDMPPGLMREIPAELFRQVLENTTPEDFGITSQSPPRLFKDENGKPILGDSVRFSPDGQTVIIGGSSSNYHGGHYISSELYSIQGKHIPLLDEKGKEVGRGSISTSADWRVFVKTSQNFPFISYLYSPQRGEPIATLQNEEGKPIECGFGHVEVSPDGQAIIALERDTYTARVYSPEGGKPIATLRDETGRRVRFNKITFSADRQTIIARCEMWSEGTCLFTTEGQYIGTVTREEGQRMATLPDKQEKPSVTFLDEKGKPIKCAFKGVKVSPDGKTISVEEENTRIYRFYNAEGGKPIATLQDEGGRPFHCWRLEFSPDWKTYVSMGGGIEKIYFFDKGLFEKEIFKQMKEKLSFNELALIRVLESVKKNWKAEHPDEPFSTSPIQLTCALLETHLTAKDFTKENIKQTKALFKQTYEWVSSTLESTKSKSLIPQVGTCHDYIRETYALEENPPNLGKAPPYMVALAKVGRSLEETDRFHEEMIPPTTFWGVLTSWISPGASKEDTDEGR